MVNGPFSGKRTITSVQKGRWCGQSPQNVHSMSEQLSTLIDREQVGQAFYITEQGLLYNGHTRVEPGGIPPSAARSHTLFDRRRMYALLL